MAAWTRSTNKYHSRKVEYDGRVFDSAGERDRYISLVLLEKSGMISNLKTQVPFLLQPSFKKRGKTYRAINYVADFTYEVDGKKMVEDFKGYRTKEYMLKLKLFEYKYQDLYLIETSYKIFRKAKEKVRVAVIKKPSRNVLGGQMQWK